MTLAQQRFVELEKLRKEVLDQFDAALEAVEKEIGVGSYFQDEEGVVYKVITPAGRWVKFEALSYLRTRRNGEEKGSLSAKEAQAQGFTV